MYKVPVILFGLPGGTEWLLILAFLGLGLWWIFTIIEIARGRYENENDKIVWLLVVILLGILGLIIYKAAGPRPLRNG
jgi:predicted membrane channel-forming protein YqfA (hemolysin III family)